MPLTTPLTPPPIEPQAHREHVFRDLTIHDVIRVWPDPACFSLIPGRSWQEYRPRLHTRFAERPPPDPVYDDFLDLRGWSPRLEPLFKAVPEPIREALLPLCETICWAALRLVAAVPEALDLAPNHLSLLAMLALKAEQAPDPGAAFEQVRVGLRGPRRGLLPLVGLPPSRALVRVVAKLDPFALAAPGPDEVVELLLSDEPELAKPLRHLRKIRADLIQVLGTPELRRLCTFALLADADEGAIGWGLNRSLETIRRVREEGRAPVRPARFGSRAEVDQFLLQLGGPPDRSSCWNPEEFGQPFVVPVGEEVVHGDPRLHLRPVTSAEEMLDRAIEDRLCIATDSSYPESAAGGDGALFVAGWAKGDEKGRATVWIRRGPLGWGLGDARGPSNQKVPAWLAERLEDWVELLNPVPEEPGPSVSAPESGPVGRPVQWSCRLLDFGEEAATGLPPVVEYADRWPSSIRPGAGQCTPP